MTHYERMAGMAEDAKQTMVHTFDEEGVYQINLFTHIMQSAPKTTCPAGIGYVNYIKQVDAHDELSPWELRKWIGHGSKSLLIDTVDTEEEAKGWLWEKHTIAFNEDDQRNTAYYMTKEEAQDAYNQSYGNN